MSAGANQWAQWVLGVAEISSGQLALSDDHLAELARHVHEAPDRKDAATALVALATRLQAIPGARPVTNQVVALAALALGDEPISQAFHLRLYGG
jgi:hypothetical protein